MKDVTLFPFYRWCYRLVLQVPHFCNCRAVSSSDSVYEFPHFILNQALTSWQDKNALDVKNYLAILGSWTQFQCVWNKASPHTTKQFLGHQQDTEDFNSILTHLPRDSVKFYRVRAQSHKTTPSPPNSDAGPKPSLSPVLLINWP